MEFDVGTNDSTKNVGRGEWSKGKKIREICTSGISESGEFIQSAVAVKLKILHKSKLKGVPCRMTVTVASLFAGEADAKRGVLLSKEKR